MQINTIIGKSCLVISTGHSEILISHGKPIAIRTDKCLYVLEGLKGTSRKHLNKFRKPNEEVIKRPKSWFAAISIGLPLEN